MGSVLISSLTSLNLSLYMMPKLFYARGHLKPAQNKQVDSDALNIEKTIHKSFASMNKLVSPGLVKAIFVSLNSSLCCKSNS
jgi:hypothetical protein